MLNRLAQYRFFAIRPLLGDLAICIHEKNIQNHAFPIPCFVTESHLADNNDNTEVERTRAFVTMVSDAPSS